MSRRFVVLRIKIRTDRCDLLDAEFIERLVKFADDHVQPLTDRFDVVRFFCGIFRHA